MFNQRKVEDENYNTTFSGIIAIINPIKPSVCVFGVWKMIIIQR
jgi:hypothetical protein